MSQWFSTKSSRTKASMRRALKSRRWLIRDDRTDDSAESPTGRVYIGVSKRPLQPAKNGYGYKGVLLQTDNREFVQCHLCGKWFMRLNRHITQDHKTTTEKYKKTFGLLPSNGLVSDSLSYKLEAAGRKRFKKYREQELAKLEQARPQSLKARLTRKKIDLDEHNNRYGLCEKQLGFRLLSFIRQYQMLPFRAQKGEGSYIAKALYRRYGSVNDGFKHYGLPSFYRKGTAVELAAPNGKQMFFNYNRDYTRKNVYTWMNTQCKIEDRIAFFRD